MSTDTEDSRPQKRLYILEDAPSEPSTTSTPSNSNLNNLTRHKEFWFDDGSVVLVARNTDFRVFCFLLAAQLTIFSSMLSSSGLNAEEMFEWCPVVRLSAADSPHNVAHVLCVLFPRYQIRLYVRNACFSFDCIFATICLAHKYDVEEVFDQAIHALEEWLTDDFDIWESEKEVVMIEYRQAIAVIDLARLLDEPALLPVAFYECAQLGGSLLHGYAREDKSVEHLAQRDVICCIDGRNKLAAKAVALISELFATQPCAQCETRGHCQGTLKTMLEEAIASDHASRPNVLSSWKGVIKVWAKEYRLCGSCEQTAMDRETEARRKVWGALPEIIGFWVESWPSSEGNESSGGDAALAAPAV